MQKICAREKCTGCTACANVCPHSAIRMYEDDCGYWHPVIDKDLCVDCGLCVKTCPVNVPLPLIMPKACFAAVSANEDELKSCSSGGMATVLSRHVINNGGVVYGCSGENVTHFIHVRVDNENGLENLKGSKYIQSDMGNVMQSVRKDLIGGLKVLFVGTPCQVAGLRNYLHKDYSNLFTIDLVCHGVPSQKMFNENLLRYTDNPDDAIVAFRRKLNTPKGSKIEFGWNYTSKQTGKNIFRPYNKDFYMFGFLRCLTFRENCYTCPYARNERVGDITLCDFWGLQADAGFEQGKGVSAVLVNTEQGVILFDSVKDTIIYKERTVLEATRWNDQLNTPSIKSKRYERFKRLYINRNFFTAMSEAYAIDYLYDCYINIKNRIKISLIR